MSEDIELAGEMDDPVCNWCGSTCYDAHAELVDGKRLCREPCVEEYAEEQAEAWAEAVLDELEGHA